MNISDIDIKGFKFSFNLKSKRIIEIEIKDNIINKLSSLFNKFNLTKLEYKPFTRFTVAKKLDDVSNGKLSLIISKILNHRKNGCIIIKTNFKNININEEFLTKLSTAISYLIGLPNHDAMTNNYYAKFYIKHKDNSDSYLRKAYNNMDLHTDGTYVKEKTDWLLMSKIEEKNAKGGETTLLHLDDWEYLKELSNNPTGRENFVWGSPKSKNISYKVEHPIFFDDKNGRSQISYIDQFPEPKNMKQGLFLQKLSDCLEESQKKIIINLPPGSTVLANNYFWLHGRRPFIKNKNLTRALIRIRGTFYKKN